MAEQLRLGRGASQALLALGELRNLIGLRQESSSSSVMDAPWTYALSRANTQRLTGFARNVLRAEGAVGRGDLRGAADLIEGFLKDAQWVVNLTARLPKERQESIAGFDVMVMPGVDSAVVEQIRVTLKEVSRLLRSKFPQVVYGQVLISKSVEGGLAHYVPALDTLYVGSDPGSKGLLYSVLHELGHRYETKFWKDKAQRDAFEDFTHPRPVPKYRVVSEGERRELAELLVQVLEKKRRQVPKVVREYLARLSRTDAQRLRQLVSAGDMGAVRDLVVGAAGPLQVREGLTRGEPVLASPYGAKSASENFAEAFARYVLGQSLPGPMLEVMDHL